MLECFQAARGRSDDVVAARPEEALGEVTEARMVVDNQNSLRHLSMVPVDLPIEPQTSPGITNSCDDSTVRSRKYPFMPTVSDQTDRSMGTLRPI